MSHTWLELRARLQDEGLPLTFGRYPFGSWRYVELRRLVRLFDGSYKFESGQRKFDLCKRLCELRVNTHPAPERAAVTDIREGRNLFHARSFLSPPRSRFIVAGGLSASKKRARDEDEDKGHQSQDTGMSIYSRDKKRSRIEEADIEEAITAVKELSVFDCSSTDYQPGHPVRITEAIKELLVGDGASKDSQPVSPSLIFLCPVCYEEKHSSEFLPMPKDTLCTHANTVCELCFRNQITIAAEFRSPNEIMCPEPDCDKFLSYSQIAQYVSAERLTIFEEYLTQRALQDDPHFIACANPECNDGAYVDDNDEDDFILCESCEEETCMNCKEIRHKDMSCAANKQRLKVEQAIAAEKDATLKVIHQISKPCPGPGYTYSIQRISGCAHMYCPRCRTHFCWECLGVGSGFSDVGIYQGPRCRACGRRTNNDGFHVENSSPESGESESEEDI